MNNRLERFQKQVERLLGDDEGNVEKTQLDVMIDAVIRWLFCNLFPILIVALIINITLMFVTPVEIIMSKWFLLKDPLSFVAGYVIVKILHSQFFRNQSGS